MAAPEKTEQEKKNDVVEALYLMRTPEWKQYIEFLRRRCVRLQHGVNEAVEKGDVVEARIQLGLMKGAQKQVEAFQQQTLQNRATLNPKGEKRVG